jgi:hypothetical protein
LFVAADTEDLKRLAAAHSDIPIFNLTLGDNALREWCLPNVFHVIPSQRMKENAIDQWQRQHPGMEVTARAWHPEFTKYAATQLNIRFKRTHGRPMDDHAWAGWALWSRWWRTVWRAYTTAIPPNCANS